MQKFYLPRSSVWAPLSYLLFFKRSIIYAYEIDIKALRCRRLKREKIKEYQKKWLVLILARNIYV